MYAKLTKIDRESHNWSEEMKFYRSTKGIELPHFSLILKIHWKLFLILMPPRVYFLNWRYVSKISGKFQFFNGIKCSEEANHFHFSSSINFHKDLPNPNLFCIQFLPIPPHFLLIQTESSKLSNAGIKSPQKFTFQIPLLPSFPTIQFSFILSVPSSCAQTGNGYSNKQSGSDRKRSYGAQEHRRGLRSESAHFIIPRPLRAVCVTHTVESERWPGKGQ